ncbi:MAG: CCA tRNA nucleotidyltransferase [Pseudomonadota bacterium]
MKSESSLIQPSAETQRRFDWLEAAHLKKIVAALEKAAPGGNRFVGGCVRDSLFAVAPKDFDLATVLPPEDVVRALTSAGLKYAPTGLAHGTVTAIAEHQGVEVTTLRKDVSTDGRRATVAYTDDWAIDAARRDFTINAIYLTPQGLLFDPVNGLTDINVRRVQFIGDAETRIREDYLRILRFFRFSARFAETFDEAGLAACKTLSGGLSQLSAERIGAEFMAILSLPRPGAVLKAMAAAGVLEKVWSSGSKPEAVARLKALAPHAPAPIALAALFSDAGDGIESALRLSNAEGALRKRALAGLSQIKRGLTEKAVRALIYRLGRDGFADAVALAGAFQRIDRTEYERLTSILDQWLPPVFPASGKDVVALGIEKGPAISAILEAAEKQWIEEDFPEVSRVKAILKESAAAFAGLV